MGALMERRGHGDAGDMGTVLEGEGHEDMETLLETWEH